MKTKQVDFLEKLGYIVEGITYTLGHDNDRYGEDTYDQCEVNLAYKKETAEIKEFKETKTHWHKADSNYKIQDFILEKVYKKEFEEALYTLVLKSL